jgi:glycine/D-amino acid oxidase-like deaminating enzyme
MLATAPTTEVQLTHPVYARWGFDYWQQRPDGTIAMGGARDLAETDEWTIDAVPTDDVQRALERRLRGQLGVHAPITHRWAAIVGYTGDGLPVLAEVRPGVWAIGGYCGTGNVVGSLLGRGLARWRVGGDDSLVRPFLHADD